MHQVTVTGKTGPNRAVTAAVLTNVRRVDFQLAEGRLFIQTETGAGDNIKEFELAGVTTVECTITAGAYAFVVS